MNTPKLTIGERLKDLRTSHRLTSKDVCNQLDKQFGYSLSIGKYNEIERDEDKDFGYRAFVHLARLFNVSVDYLTGNNDYPAPDYNNQTVHDLTGLSETAISNLSRIFETNRATWDTDIINTIIESDNFIEIIEVLREALTYQKQSLQYGHYITDTEELGKHKASNLFEAIMRDIAIKYEASTLPDNRIAYYLLYGMFEDGKLTREQLDLTVQEFDKGNFEFNPIKEG